MKRSYTRLFVLNGQKAMCAKMCAQKTEDLKHQDTLCNRIRWNPEGIEAAHIHNPVYNLIFVFCRNLLAYWI